MWGSPNPWLGADCASCQVPTQMLKPHIGPFLLKDMSPLLMSLDMTIVSDVYERFKCSHPDSVFIHQWTGNRQHGSRAVLLKVHPSWWLIQSTWGGACHSELLTNLRMTCVLLPRARTLSSAVLEGCLRWSAALILGPTWLLRSMLHREVRQFALGNQEQNADAISQGMPKNGDTLFLPHT